MIPKKVHVTWKSKDIINSDSPMIENGIKAIQSMNPDWEVIVYDDLEIDQYLKQMISPQNYQLIENEHPVVKSDVWRLIKMYEEGGIYTDIDRYYNIPFSDVIDEDTACIIPTYNSQDFSHDIMISAPGNPIYATTYELVMRRRTIGHNNVYYLGPQTYMHGITLHLFGEIIDSNPGPDVFNHLRNSINQIPNYKCIEEHPPLNTVFYKHDGKQELEDWEGIKRSLYKQYNMRHWTNQW